MKWATVVVALTTMLPVGAAGSTGTPKPPAMRTIWELGATTGVPRACGVAISGPGGSAGRQLRPVFVQLIGTGRSRWDRAETGEVRAAHDPARQRERSCALLKDSFRRLEVRAARGGRPDRPDRSLPLVAR